MHVDGVMTSPYISVLVLMCGKFGSKFVGDLVRVLSKSDRNMSCPDVPISV